MRFPFDRLANAGRSDPDRFLFGPTARALLRAARVFLWPLPLRAGLRLSLVDEPGPARTLSLSAGPWPDSPGRATAHLILHRKDWDYWVGVFEKIGASRRIRDSLGGAQRGSGARLPGRGGPARDSGARPAGGASNRGPGRSGSAAGPSRLIGRWAQHATELRQAIRAASRLQGGVQVQLHETGGGTHSLYLVFNHRDPKPPADLLHVEIPEPVLDDLLQERLDLTTALIRQQVRVHGNLEVIAGLEGLLPSPDVPTFRPNLYTGRTDHPLDKGCDPHRQVLVPPLRAACVLAVEKMHREGSAFRFTCRGYDVYRTRQIGMLHAYDTSEGVPWEPLTLVLSWVSPNTFRLRCARGSQVPENHTPMLAGPVPEPGFEPACREFDDRYELTSPELRLVVHRRDFRIEVFGPEGRVAVMGGRQKDGFMNLVDTLPLGFVTDLETGRGFAVANFELDPGEAVFGFGEHYGTVNKRGQTVSLWNEEGMGHSTGRNYKNIPFFMSTRGYGVFVNQALPMTFFVGSRFFPRHELAAEGDLLDLFCFYGPSLKRIQGEYTALTGRPAMVPRWSLGLWVSRISYLSQEEVLAVARRIREEGWPADVIHIDTGWFEKEWQCDWRFSGRRFPDPEGMIRRLHDLNLRLSLWQWPYLIEGLELKEQAEARGALARGEVFNLGMRIHHIDFTRPEGVAFYQEQLARLLEMGVDAIKTDFGEYVLDHLEFQAGPGRAFKNLYALLYNRAAFEVLERKRPGDAVLWARSAYAGSQRYPVHWSGDSACTFEDMLCALRGGLSLGLSGFTFWSNDVGGFSGTPSDELYARWTAWSVFNSHMRLHGGPPRFREPWNYEPRTQEIFRKLLSLRYRLIPYLYSEARRSCREGLPVLRHLAFEFQEDPTSWNVEDQFLFGASILVAPILTEDERRNVWIPPGLWYEAQGGGACRGPRWVRVTSDLSGVPHFFRGGHAVPWGPEASWVANTPTREMTLRLFADDGGRAGGIIEEEGGQVEVSAVTREGLVEITIRGPDRAYDVELYGFREGSGISLNGRRLDGVTVREGIRVR